MIKFPEQLKNLSLSKIYPFLIIVIVVLLSVSSPSSSPLNTRNLPQNNFPTSTTTVTPSSASEVTLKINSTYPTNDTVAQFTGQRSALTLYFNKPLTNNEIESLKIYSTPSLSFRKTIHSGRTTLYLTPQQAWKNGKYTIHIIISNRSLAKFTFESVLTSNQPGGVDTSVPDQSSFPLPKVTSTPTPTP